MLYFGNPMSVRFYDKLNGWPAMTLGTLVLAGVAYFAFYSFGHLEKEGQELLLQLEASHNDNFSLIL